VWPVTETNGAVALEFAYDHQGRRVQKNTYELIANNWEQTETKFVYDGWNLISEVRSQGSEVSTNLYTWGIDLSGTLQGAGGVGGLLAQITDDGTTVNCSYAAGDANGNITDYVDDAGTVVAHFEYDAFGNITAESGSQKDNLTFRFSSKYQDPETQLSYYGFRYYSPELGRWLNRDPIGENGGMNLYAFIGNRACSDIDILGLTESKTACDCHSITISGVDVHLFTANQVQSGEEGSVEFNIRVDSVMYDINFTGDSDPCCNQFKGATASVKYDGTAGGKTVRGTATHDLGDTSKYGIDPNGNGTIPHDPGLKMVWNNIGYNYPSGSDRIDIDWSVGGTACGTVTATFNY
jgi:RHS repeat-associated protein